MKLAFSTMGCPEFKWREIYTMARDCGFHGLELWNVRETENVAKHFTEQRRAEALQQLKDSHLELPCLTVLSPLNQPAPGKDSYEELRKDMELAAEIGIPFVSCATDFYGDVTPGIDEAEIIAKLKKLLPFAEAHGITLLIETSGAYADTEKLAELLTALASDNVGALWNSSNPYRFNNESPETTIKNLGAYVKFVHMKDSIVEDGKVCYRLPGEGDLPFEEMIKALDSINYEGYLSLEWFRFWAPFLYESAIVFPHFIHFMSGLMGENVTRPQLFDNKAGTGKYVWEKDVLIDLTFPQVLDRMVEEFPRQYAFRYTTLDYTRTYSEFRDDVDAFARSLIALGVKQGDHVAVWANNVPQWYISFWATTKIGAVLVTVNTAYKIHEIEYLLRQSDTHTLVMGNGFRDSDYVAIMKELCPELATATPGQPLHVKRLPFLRNIITIESEQPGCLTWEQALAMGEEVAPEAVARRALMVDKDHVCNIQDTSGTAGCPKGVLLTHHNVVNNGKCIGDCMDLSTADRMMVQVPMFHCFGMVLSMTASMTHGATLSPLPYFRPNDALDCINKEKITCFNGVPTMFISMLQHEKFPETDFSYMRTGIMAGSPCPAKVMQEVVDKMNMTDITIVYGQTEASPGCTQSRVEDSLDVRVNTVGRNLPGIECKIVDPESGKELPDDQIGEFCARGYNVMKGYYKMPGATAATIDEDGWLHTGDLALRQPDGNFRITGRLKDMIIRGGENIYPKEIEDFIYTHPAVKDVQVIGVPDEKYGEEIMACVVLKDGEKMTAEEMQGYVRDHMARHKTPRYVVFMDAFPMNAAGKILKYKMREEAEALLAQAVQK